MQLSQQDYSSKKAKKLSWKTKNIEASDKITFKGGTKSDKKK